MNAVSPFLPGPSVRTTNAVSPFPPGPSGRTRHKNVGIRLQRSQFRFLPREARAGNITISRFISVKSRRPPLRIEAAAADAIIEAPEIKADSDEEITVDLLACPICYKPLIRKGPSGLNLSAISRSAFECAKCRKAYSNRDVYIDLTVTAGSSEYSEARPISTELFRNPLVSFAYERGWRQNFATSGFPGPDEEFRMAQKYFEPAAGGLLVDASCGSGLFSRRFAKCGIYSGVVALDFSENMLRQCYEFIKGDKDLSTVNLALVRADISRLPFATSSIDAVHAGAAIHCWPSPSTAVAEISRILRPGGVFVATTFVPPDIFDLDIVKPLRQAVKQATNISFYLTAKELEDLVKACGLVDYSVIRRQAFIMFSARKSE
uniref:TSA: Wollemia nobilis Ref_Wollemi_Transcript_25082_1547 transcribed RNA sequence n=1 Tax=Wollemia nobilis TaxID=56998 RepID=A0A0C9RQI4_9CONI